MTTKICFLHTTINGTHNTNEDVSTKNLYNYARLVALHYTICNYENGELVEIKKSNTILKPKTINFTDNNGITMEEAIKDGIDNNVVISQFKNDLSDVNVIVSHDINKHLKAIQVECFRTAILIDFSKFTIIDTISFNHKYKYPTLLELAKNLKIKTKNITIIDQIKVIFLNLYKTYISVTE